MPDDIGDDLNALEYTDVLHPFTRPCHLERSSRFAGKLC
jgi:hypothetical protein